MRKKPKILQQSSLILGLVLGSFYASRAIFHRSCLQTEEWNLFLKSFLVDNGDDDDESVSLTQILNQSGSDKYWRHHYENYYETWLEPYRARPGIRIAEIGAKEGKSLDAWSKYFSSPGLIMGLAYGQSSMGVEQKVRQRFENKPVQILRGDQSDRKALAKLCESGPFDIIIDDGSHVPEHVVFTFMTLWKYCVKPGGLYVVEDVETNYWDERKAGSIYGYPLVGTGIGVSPNQSAVEKLKQLIDILPRYQLGQVEEMKIFPGDEQIRSIEFGMNIVALFKFTKKQMQRRPRTNIGEVVDEERIQQYIKNARATNPRIIRPVKPKPHNSNPFSSLHSGENSNVSVTASVYSQSKSKLVVVG